MKKLLIISSVALFLFSACAGSGGKLDLRVSSLALETTSEGSRNLEFSVYLEREDLGLRQPDNSEGKLLTADLPTTLQPKLMYVSSVDDVAPDSGTMCDRPRYPHTCSVDIGGEDFEKASFNYLVKVTFEDGTFMSKEVQLAFPSPLENPTLVQPEETPGQNSKVDLKFSDVGADFYRVEVNMCGPYENDGINPCLDGIEYSLVRENDELVSEFEEEIFAPVISIEEGVVHLISDFNLVFSDSVEFVITASKESKSSSGIPIYVESTEVKNFAN